MNIQTMSLPLIVLAAALLTGCSTGTDLVKSGQVTLEPTLTSTLAQPPEVTREGDDLVVSGRVERRTTDLSGHVDVTVIAPGGATFFGARLNYNEGAAGLDNATGPRAGSFSKIHNHRYGSYGAYYVRFPGLPPEGSIVKVRHIPASQP